MENKISYRLVMNLSQMTLLDRYVMCLLFIVYCLANLSEIANLRLTLPLTLPLL